jgi:hypothetical protein
MMLCRADLLASGAAKVAKDHRDGEGSPDETARRFDYPEANGLGRAVAGWGETGLSSLPLRPEPGLVEENGINQSTFSAFPCLWSETLLELK